MASASVLRTVDPLSAHLASHAAGCSPTEAEHAGHAIAGEGLEAETRGRGLGEWEREEEGNGEGEGH